MSNTGQYRGIKSEGTSGPADFSDGKQRTEKNVETPDQMLHRLADLFHAKAREYGDSYKRHGPVMAALFPGGITLKNADDFGRFAIFDLMVVKLVRYTTDFNARHADSLDDLAVYTAMLREMDRG
jgi:hypothetical protein